MQKLMLVTASLLFVTASTFAQPSSPANSVSVFVSDVAFTSSASSGSRLDVSYGAAFAHLFSKHISAELSVTKQPFRRYVSTFSSRGELPVSFSYMDEVYPIDANISYHFITDSRWKPYVGVGARYLRDSFLSSGPLGRYRLSFRSVDPEISGGVTFQFRPSLGLRLDGKEIAGGGESFLSHATFTGSAGLSFRF
jgi:outer membrane protein W